MLRKSCRLDKQSLLHLLIWQGEGKGGTWRASRWQRQRVASGARTHPEQISPVQQGTGKMAPTGTHAGQCCTQVRTDTFRVWMQPSSAEPSAWHPVQWGQECPPRPPGPECTDSEPPSPLLLSPEDYCRVLSPQECWHSRSTHSLPGRETSHPKY